MKSLPAGIVLAASLLVPAAPALAQGEVTPPAGLWHQAEGSSVKIGWNPVEGATGYNIYRNGDYIDTVMGRIDYTLEESPGNYTYQVVAFDDSQNYSEMTGPIAVKVVQGSTEPDAQLEQATEDREDQPEPEPVPEPEPAAEPQAEPVAEQPAADVTAPNIPHGVIHDFDGDSVRLTWNRSVDDVEVIGYNIYVDNDYRYTVLDANHTFTQPNPAGSTFTVVAFDGSENYTAQSAPSQPSQAQRERDAAAEPVDEEATDREEQPDEDTQPTIPLHPIGPIPEFEERQKERETDDEPEGEEDDDSGDNNNGGDNSDEVTDGAPQASEENQAPTAPTVVNAAVTTDGVDVRWSGATDDNRVAGYNVYRNDDYVDTVNADRTDWFDNEGVDGDAYSVTSFDDGGTRLYSSQSSQAIANGGGATATNAEDSDGSDGGGDVSIASADTDFETGQHVETGGSASGDDGFVQVGGFSVGSAAGSSGGGGASADSGSSGGGASADSEPELTVEVQPDAVEVPDVQTVPTLETDAEGEDIWATGDDDWTQSQQENPNTYEAPEPDPLELNGPGLLPDMQTAAQGAIDSPNGPSVHTDTDSGQSTNQVSGSEDGEGDEEDGEGSGLDIGPVSIEWGPTDETEQTVTPEANGDITISSTETDGYGGGISVDLGLPGGNDQNNQGNEEEEDDGVELDAGVTVSAGSEISHQQGTTVSGPPEVMQAVVDGGQLPTIDDSAGNLPPGMTISETNGGGGGGTVGVDGTASVDAEQNNGSEANLGVNVGGSAGVEHTGQSVTEISRPADEAGTSHHTENVQTGSSSTTTYEGEVHAGFNAGGTADLDPEGDGEDGPTVSAEIAISGGGGIKYETETTSTDGATYDVNTPDGQQQQQTHLDTGVPSVEPDGTVTHTDSQQTTQTGSGSISGGAGATLNTGSGETHSVSSQTAVSDTAQTSNGSSTTTTFSTESGNLAEDGQDPTELPSDAEEVFTNTQSTSSGSSSDGSFEFNYSDDGTADGPMITVETTNPNGFTDSAVLSPAEFSALTQQGSNVHPDNPVLDDLDPYDIGDGGIGDVGNLTNLSNSQQAAQSVIDGNNYNNGIGSMDAAAASTSSQQGSSSSISSSGSGSNSDSDSTPDPSSGIGSMDAAASSTSSQQGSSSGSSSSSGSGGSNSGIGSMDAAASSSSGGSSSGSSGSSSSGSSSSDSGSGGSDSDSGADSSSGSSGSGSGSSGSGSNGSGSSGSGSNVGSMDAAASSQYP